MHPTGGAERGQPGRPGGSRHPAGLQAGTGVERGIVFPNLQLMCATQQDRVLGTAAPVRHLSWAAGQLEAAVLAQLAAQLGDPNSRRPPATLIHTWRPLILCSQGDQPSTQAQSSQN